MATETKKTTTKTEDDPLLSMLRAAVDAECSSKKQLIEDRCGKLRAAVDAYEKASKEDVMSSLVSRVMQRPAAPASADVPAMALLGLVHEIPELSPVIAAPKPGEDARPTPQTPALSLIATPPEDDGDDPAPALVPRDELPSLRGSLAARPQRAVVVVSCDDPNPHKVAWLRDGGIRAEWKSIGRGHVVSAADAVERLLASGRTEPAGMVVVSRGLSQDVIGRIRSAAAGLKIPVATTHSLGSGQLRTALTTLDGLLRSDAHRHLLGSVRTA